MGAMMGQLNVLHVIPSNKGYPTYVEVYYNI